MRIVWLDRATFSPSIDATKPSFPHEWIEYEETGCDDVVDRLRGANIAITNKVSLGRAEVAELPELRMIAVAATGYDVIDVDACRDAGVVVSNVRGYAESSVPEHAFALSWSSEYLGSPLWS